VKALSWADVNSISEAFRALNPYDRAAVSSSVLEIEKDNFDSKPRKQQRKQRQLWCIAISAKRYVIFLKDSRGEPLLLREDVNNEEDRWSEHGLGHLLNPTDPDSDDRKWIGRVWLNIARRTLGLPTRDLGFEALPAVGRIAVTSPPLLRPFAGLNHGKRYGQQVKPFNFLSTCHVRPFGHPDGVRPERFQLISPYEPNPQRWLKTRWIDRYSENTFRITTRGHHGGPGVARVQTYGDIIKSYEYHPEAKFADAKGRPCSRDTVGLLQRRHIRIGLLTNIGKESNSLEEVQAGIEHEEADVYTEYRDPHRSRWVTTVLPAVREAPLVTLERMCRGQLSRRALIDIRAARSTPHRRNQQLLETVVRRLRVLVTR